MSAPIEATTSIVAPPDRIWAVLSDVVRWPIWLTTMTAVEPLDGAELKVGRRYRITQPKLPPALWTVIRLDPGRAFAWESRAPGVRSVADHVLRPRPDGSTSVTLRIETTGPLAFLVRLFFGTLTEEYVTREAALLKHEAEGEGVASG